MINRKLHFLSKQSTFQINAIKISLYFIYVYGLSDYEVTEGISFFILRELVHLKCIFSRVDRKRFKSSSI